MTEAAPRVSVVIPARDEEQVIAGCLQSLRGQSVSAENLEVVVVVAGTDRTSAVAARAGAGHFGRFEIVTLETGNKNVALQVGCRRVRGDVVVLLDADTEPEPDALAELQRVLAREPRSVVHGAARPRIDTWVSRYWELNRKLVKDLRFDGNLSGEMVALPRAAVVDTDLADLFPAGVSAQDDLHLGRALQRRGWRIVYAPQARATTLVPWTVRGLMSTMLRSRRGLMRLLPFGEAAAQAAKSALLVAVLPITVVAWQWLGAWSLVCTIPLALQVLVVAWRVARLQQRGLGDFRRGVPAFIVLDLIARGMKLWAFAERLGGSSQPVAFRGERPGAAPVASTNS